MFCRSPGASRISVLHKFSFRFSCLPVCLIAFAVLLSGGAGAGVVRLEFRHEAAGAPLRIPAPPGAGALEITRLDYLLTGLALRRADGSWMEAASGWTAFIGSEAGRLSALAEGVPAGEYTAVRFRVGVSPKQNAADPNGIVPGHALHPEVNKLHWGWQGGYVFLALEGRSDGAAFSYHVATDPNLMTVELPVNFDATRPATIRIALDAARILEGVVPSRDGNATHSRPGDPLAARLKANIERAFRVVSVKGDVFQETSAQLADAAAPPGTTPFPLEISTRLPRVELPRDNPLTVEGVELGRRLFHEPRLSGNNTQSCASCHSQPLAFGDARQVSAGAEGQKGRRNSMPLFNLAWARTFFWDGRAKTLREQVLMPIEDPAEMNAKLDDVLAKLRADAGYMSEFARAFGSGGITRERLAMALEQFLITLVSQDSKFDRAARKLETLTSEEQRGLELFVTEHDPARGLRGADCFHCHGGNLFTNGQFANNGLTPGADAGRLGVTHEEADRGKFKVPSLRNVAASAPYMHDGRFQTLEEVVEHYDRGVHRSATLDPNLAKHPAAGLGLSAEDKRALVAFLRTLTDESFLQPTAQQPAPRLAREK